MISRELEYREIRLDDSNGNSKKFRGVTQRDYSQLKHQHITGEVIDEAVKILGEKKVCEEDRDERLADLSDRDREELPAEPSRHLLAKASVIDLVRDRGLWST